MTKTDRHMYNMYMFDSLPLRYFVNYKKSLSSFSYTVEDTNDATYMYVHVDISHYIAHIVTW